MLTILQQTKKVKKVVLVDLSYPYGKSKVYMGGSLVAVAAQLMAAGIQVDIVDLNIDKLEDEHVKALFSKAQVIGLSVIGSPHFPQAVQMCQYLAENYHHVKVVVGGQSVRHLDDSEFRRIFGKRAVQITNHNDCTALFGPLNDTFSVPYQPVWEQMGNDRLRLYLSTEFALVLSQGCIYDCGFCGADKNTPEKHRGLELFEQDIRFLQRKAQEYDIKVLQCYATPLDFFQNPETVAEYLKVIAKVFEASKVGFKMRALCCMNTFLMAAEKLPDFAGLVRRSGLWCIGFGVDGADKEMWKLQHKLQNHASDIPKCLDRCEQLGLRTEVLMVMGYPTDNCEKLWKTLRSSLFYARHWPKVVLRPYLAKTLIPGNLGWEIYPAIIEKLIAQPAKFYNLDFCSLASPLTHPRVFQRWLANFAYLFVIGVLTPFGRCCTSPLLPQGQPGLYGWLAKIVNRFMPFDR